VSSIAADALKQITADGAVLHSVPAAEPGDPILLFLCEGTATALMLAVPAELVRSRRLRNGTSRPRDLRAEYQYEMFRVADARAFDAIPVDPDDNDDDTP
jgi:hypothetical protein